MSKVFVDVGLSLDGYIAGPHRIDYRVLRSRAKAVMRGTHTS